MICCRSNRSLSTPPYDACSRTGYWIPKKAFLPPTRRIRNYRPSEDGIKHVEKARSSFKKTSAGISRVIAVQ